MPQHRARLIILLALISITGCAADSMTAIQRVDFTRRLYVSTIEILTPLITQGVIAQSQQDKDAIWKASEKVKAMIDRAESLVLSGMSAGWEFYLQQAGQALDILLSYKMKGQKLQRARSLPTTLNLSGSLNQTKFKGVLSHQRYARRV